MIINSEHIRSGRIPVVGDIVIIKSIEYVMMQIGLGYCLVRHGKKNQEVGCHESITSFVFALREQNTWNTPRSTLRGQALNV